MNNCPTCLRKFEVLEDYPFIYVVRFKRGSIPKVIPHWHDELGGQMPPAEVLKMFQETGETLVHDGFVYQRNGPYPSATGEQFQYIKKKDLTPNVRSIAESQPVQRYLELLESCAGKEVRTKDILPRGRRLLTNLKDYSISLHEGNRRQGYRNSDVDLMGEKFSLGRAGIGSMCLATLGTIAYQGRLNTPSQFK